MPDENTLQSDFDKDYSGKSDLFDIRWKFIVEHLMEYLQRPKVITIVDQKEFVHLLQHLSEEHKVAVILYLLPCIIAPDTIRKRKSDQATNNSTQKKNRLTVKECRDSFFLHVEDSATLNSALDEHKKILHLSGLSFQPTFVLVGPIHAVESSYVVVEDTIYEVDTPVDALKLCFKIFWALDCQYPQRANSLWRFIQVVGFQINIKDRCHQTTLSIIHDIEKKISAASNMIT
ncbi:hypothetical protein HCN44_003451 [Aphidius gifuensis]|uniref:Uncharacterized protein n=1 Tax=Aphidius gifuensis TaxID=684658 RepID=A0A835CMY9_APHGI|nr:hypothetical protein HCN44_003451 [Aphidius gifuensis]